VKLTLLDYADQDKLQPTATVFNEIRSDEVSHNWFILYSTAYYVMSFSDVTDDSYFIFYW
jgi:hypothetical protein